MQPIRVARTKIPALFPPGAAQNWPKTSKDRPTIRFPHLSSQNHFQCQKLGIIIAYPAIFCNQWVRLLYKTDGIFL